MALTDGIEIPLGNLKTQLKEAQKEVQALADKFGATSEQAIEAAKKAADLKDRIGDAKSLTDAFNPDAKFKALSSSLAGVAGGFAAVQGAMALFGAQNKDVEKALLKVQAAMALSQGLNAIGDANDAYKRLSASIKSSTAFKVLDTAATNIATVAQKAFGISVDTTATSFKVLKGAIAATGIGLLVIGIGYLIEKLMSFSNASEEATKKQKEFNEQVAKGAREGLKANEKILDADIKLKLAKAKLRGASEKELYEIEQQGIKDKIELRKRSYETALKSDKDLASNIAEQNAEAQDQLTLNQIEFQTKEQERLKEHNKKLEEERLAAIKKKEENEAKARKAGYEFHKIELENQEKQKEKDKKDAEEQAKADEEFLAAEFEKENKLQEAAQIRTNNIILQKDKEKDAALQAYIQKKEIQLAEIELLYGLVDVIRESGIKNRAIQATAVIAENAAGIGRIIINTQIANAKAVAMSPITGGMPFVAINNISAGLGIVASILATKNALSKLGSGGSAGNAPSMAANGSAPMQPQRPESQMTQLDQTSINALGNQAIKAYVVETDMTTNQQRIKAIQQRARFG
jgi:hypothetical protein